MCIQALQRCFSKLRIGLGIWLYTFIDIMRTITKILSLTSYLVGWRPCTTYTCSTLNDPVPCEYQDSTIILYHYAPVSHPACPAPSAAVSVEPWRAHPDPCPDH